MEVNTEVCRYCRRDIPDYSILTHEAHCERGRRLRSGQPLSPEPPRSPSPVVEEPSECSVVSTPGEVEVTTLALDSPSWNDNNSDKKTPPKTSPDSTVTYIPIQLPNNGKFDSYLYNLDEGKGEQGCNGTLTNSPDDESDKKSFDSNYGVRTSWIYPEKAKKDEIWETIPESLLETSSNKSSSSVYDPGTSKDEYNAWKNIPETVLNFKEDKDKSPEGLDKETATNLDSFRQFLKDINLESINKEVEEKSVPLKPQRDFDPDSLNASGSQLNDDTESLRSFATASTLKLGEDKKPVSKLNLENKDFDKDSLNSGLSTPSTVFDLEENNLDRNSVKLSPNKDLGSPGFSGVTCPDCHRVQKAGGLRQHLDQECPFRSKPCSFCGVPYRGRDLECHMVVCGTRSEKCPDCEEMIMLKYKHIHLESNHGFIKLDDEPENLTGWTPLPRLPLRPPDLIKNIPLSTKDEDAKVEIPCEFCDQIFPAYRLTVHQLGCRLKQQTNEKITKNANNKQPVTSNKTTYDYPKHLSPPPPSSSKKTKSGPKIHHHIPTIVDAMPKYSPDSPGTSKNVPIVHHVPTIIQPAPGSGLGKYGKPKAPQPKLYTTSVHHVPTSVQTRPNVHYIPTVLEGTPRSHHIPTTILQNGHSAPKEHRIPIIQESGRKTNLAKSNSVPLAPDTKNIDVISFGNVLEVSDKFKKDWTDLENRIRDNSKDDLHVIPCEYCCKMLRIGEVMSHQMLCFLQQ